MDEKMSYQVGIKFAKKVDQIFVKTLASLIQSGERKIQALPIPKSLVGNHDNNEYKFYVFPEEQMAYDFIDRVSRKKLAESFVLDRIEKP